MARVTPATTDIVIEPDTDPTAFDGWKVLVFVDDVLESVHVCDTRSQAERYAAQVQDQLQSEPTGGELPRPSLMG